MPAFINQLRGKVKRPKGKIRSPRGKDRGVTEGGVTSAAALRLVSVTLISSPLIPPGFT